MSLSFEFDHSSLFSISRSHTPSLSLSMFPRNPHLVHQATASRAIDAFLTVVTVCTIDATTAIFAVVAIDAALAVDEVRAVDTAKRGVAAWRIDVTA
jgi:hypothetical protein